MGEPITPALLQKSISSSSLMQIEVRPEMVITIAGRLIQRGP